MFSLSYGDAKKSSLSPIRKDVTGDSRLRRINHASISIVFIHGHFHATSYLRQDLVSFTLSVFYDINFILAGLSFFLFSIKCQGIIVLWYDQFFISFCFSFR